MMIVAISDTALGQGAIPKRLIQIPDDQLNVFGKLRCRHTPALTLLFKACADSRWGWWLR